MKAPIWKEKKQKKLQRDFTIDGDSYIYKPKLPKGLDGFKPPKDDDFNYSSEEERIFFMRQLTNRMEELQRDDDVSSSKKKKAKPKNDKSKSSPEESQVSRQDLSGHDLEMGQQPSHLNVNASASELGTTPRQPRESDQSFRIEAKPVEKLAQTDLTETEKANQRLRPKTVPRKSIFIGKEIGDITAEQKLLDSSGSYESI